ncbi:MAG TPA: hypothetical protein DCQ52_06510, partial [Acidimicrobiaceae bacterium]|nr:hypothetical protein [Acidimicrobiaceae bacterium]
MASPSRRRCRRRRRCKRPVSSRGTRAGPSAPERRRRVRSSSMRFEDRSVRGQVARLRPLAVEVLRRYSIDVAALRLLNHGFNTTFRVDTTDGRRFALRLNVNSRRTDSFIGAEMAWLAALAEETDLWVPIPQRTLDGALLTHVRSPDLGRDLPAALFSWLPGRDLGDDASDVQMRAVGRATAALHAHGEG